MVTSFKRQLLEGVHDFRASGGHTFKLALYTSSASFDASTTTYTAANEVSETGSYTTGGGELTALGPATAGTAAFADFADIAFTGVTMTARGALVYNSTPAHTYTDPVCMVLDFGSDKTVVDGTLTVQFPIADGTNAILRIT